MSDERPLLEADNLAAFFEAPPLDFVDDGQGPISRRRRIEALCALGAARVALEMIDDFVRRNPLADEQLEDVFGTLNKAIAEAAREILKSREMRGMAGAA